MTSGIINRIGMKARIAMASVVISGVALAAAPAFVGAQGCADFDGSGHVDISDVLMVTSHYLQPKPNNGGMFTISDILDVLQQYGNSCTAS